jgi:hypothetical protein
MSVTGGSGAPPVKVGGGPLRGRFGRRSERYLFLLILLIVDVVVLFTVPAGKAWALFTIPFVAATLLLALYTTQVPRRVIIAAWVAALASVAFATIGAFSNASHLAGLAYLLMTLLIVATPVLILRRLLSHEKVTGQTVMGAVCVYVLIGLVFAFIFMGVNGVSSQPFLAQGPNDEPSTYVYLSFITLATVGYGDYTPLGDLPRALCVLEAIMGQIFLVTTVARLVSLYGGAGPLRNREGGGGS